MNEEQLGDILAEYKSYLSGQSDLVYPLVEVHLPWLLELVAELQTTTYCSYCGQEFPIDDKSAELVTQHIWECQQHPMWELQERVNKYTEIIVELNQEITHYCDIAEKLQERVRELEARLDACELCYKELQELVRELEAVDRNSFEARRSRGEFNRP